MHELLLVHSLTWFQMIIQVSQLLLSPVALIFCGHLGDTIQLDGAALAISVSTRDRDRFRHCSNHERWRPCTGGEGQTPGPHFRLFWLLD